MLRLLAKVRIPNGYGFVYKVIIKIKSQTKAESHTATHA